MTLRYKFVLPINLILLLVLAISLAWEWRRQEAMGLALLRARLGEEARFVQAASRPLGVTRSFADFLRRFCNAIDASSSPEHQVALANGLPQGHLKIIERAGHNAHEERPGPVMAAVRDFIGIAPARLTTLT